MNSKHAIKFNEIPAWTYADALDKSIYTFVTAVALAGLEDKWIRLTASVQRALLGAVVFGKQQIRVSSSDSKVTVYRKCAFGQDFESLNAHASLVAAAARSGKVLSPGKSHGKYFTGTCSDNGVSFPLSHQ